MTTQLTWRTLMPRSDAIVAAPRNKPLQPYTYVMLRGTEIFTVPAWSTDVCSACDEADYWATCASQTTGEHITCSTVRSGWHAHHDRDAAAPDTD